MQGYQYTKDTATFEQEVEAQTRARLSVLLSSVLVFLLLALCLLFIGSRSSAVCSAQGEGSVGCRDVVRLYQCAGVPIRLAVVLQTPEDGFVRFSAACKWTTARVEIRTVVTFLALVILAYGLVGLRAQDAPQMQYFVTAAPAAIALLVTLIQAAVVVIDLFSLPELVQHEDDLLNVLTGTQFEGAVEALTFTFSTFYVYSTTTAFAAAAALMVTHTQTIGCINVSDFLRREEFGFSSFSNSRPHKYLST